MVAAAVAVIVAAPRTSARPRRRALPTPGSTGRSSGRTAGGRRWMGCSLVLSAREFAPSHRCTQGAPAER
eukprot:5013886-Lingulodinium_polyedra.AAC.1